MAKIKVSSSCPASTRDGKTSPLRERVRAAVHQLAVAKKLDDPFGLTYSLTEILKRMGLGGGKTMSATRRQVARVLQDLAKLGEVQRVSDGVYRLRPDYAPQYAAIWKVIRAKKIFIIPDLVELAEADPRTVAHYVAELELAGFIHATDSSRLQWRLKRDQVQAPEPEEDALKQDLNLKGTKGKETILHKEVSSLCLRGEIAEIINDLHNGIRAANHAVFHSNRALGRINKLEGMAAHPSRDEHPILKMGRQ